MNKNIICSITNIFDDDKTFGFISNINDKYITLVYKNETSIIKKDDIRYIDIEDLSLKRNYLIDTKNYEYFYTTFLYFIKNVKKYTGCIYYTYMI
ncbi:hypothetical protein [Streptobacillus moniliformis]|uniref:hypothetical protein n=1 Tax=Streptobacillus moniliformis TaxID=34105 RepID=UPI0007E4AA8B|nr:hypothetical protein [Streptobacillus moniliformis]